MTVSQLLKVTGKLTYNMEPVILSVETATLGGSVCLSKGKHILASSQGIPRVSHSNTLLKEIDSLLREAGTLLQHIDVFAAATGPGSFTGLRIGIATIKALATTLGRQCAGVPTLAAIAHAAGISDRTLALLPAGRGEVFAQSFSVGANEVVSELDVAMHLSPSRMLDRYSSEKDLLIAGEGALLHREMIKDWATQQGIAWSELPTPTKGWRMAAADVTLASHVAALALTKVVTGQLEQPNALQAIYVRPSDAEIKQSSLK